MGYGRIVTGLFRCRRIPMRNPYVCSRLPQVCGFHLRTACMLALSCKKLSSLLSISPPPPPPPHQPCMMGCGRLVMGPFRCRWIPMRNPHVCCLLPQVRGCHLGTACKVLLSCKEFLSLLSLPSALQNGPWQASDGTVPQPPDSDEEPPTFAATSLRFVSAVKTTVAIILALSCKGFLSLLSGSQIGLQQASDGTVPQPLDPYEEPLRLLPRPLGLWL